MLLELVLGLPALLCPSGNCSVFICATGMPPQGLGQLKQSQRGWPTAGASKEGRGQEPPQYPVPCSSLLRETRGPRLHCPCHW